MKYLLATITFFSLSACSFIEKRSETRDIQTKIVGKLNENAPKLSDCAKKHNLFGSFDQKRVRVVLDITLNENGQIQKFKLDEKLYPDNFANCIFKVVDLIIFPKPEEGKIIELEQPFIFSAK